LPDAVSDAPNISWAVVFKPTVLVYADALPLNDTAIRRPDIGVVDVTELVPMPACDTSSVMLSGSPAKAAIALAIKIEVINRFM
jgi:hypothetical protein